MVEYSTKVTSKAIMYQALYLANLLLLPGLSFAYLIWVYFKGEDRPRWATIHLIRSIQLSFLAGVILVVIPLIIYFSQGDKSASLMVIVFYFVTFHASLVLIGMLNLSRAMARKLPMF